MMTATKPELSPFRFILALVVGVLAVIASVLTSPMSPEVPNNGVVRHLYNGIDNGFTFTVDRDSSIMGVFLIFDVKDSVTGFSATGAYKEDTRSWYRKHLCRSWRPNEVCRIGVLGENSYDSSNPENPAIAEALLNKALGQYKPHMKTVQQRRSPPRATIRRALFFTRKDPARLLVARGFIIRGDDLRERTECQSGEPCQIPSSCV